MNINFFQIQPALAGYHKFQWKKPARVAISMKLTAGRRRSGQAGGNRQSGLGRGRGWAGVDRYFHRSV